MMKTVKRPRVSRKRRPKTEDRRALENEDLENEDPLENKDLENKDPLKILSVRRKIDVTIFLCYKN